MADTPGRLGRALIRILMKRAAVTAIERPAHGFHLVTLTGEQLRNVAWEPGQKIQVAMGSAFAARTYTPIEWDAAAGRTRILGYAHGDGPGSAWLCGLGVGDECDLFGPRGSLQPLRMEAPLALFGDETSIGLACALAGAGLHYRLTCHFEAAVGGAAAQALARAGLAGATVLARQPGDTHLAELESALPRLAEAGAGFVLTGKAGTIQRLRHELKRLAVPSRRIMTKAYWAPGKTGLD